MGFSGTLRTWNAANRAARAASTQAAKSGTGTDFCVALSVAVESAGEIRTRPRSQAHLDGAVRTADNRRFMPPADDETDAPVSAAGQPWYAAGLRFECTGCGQCCTGGDGYVWVTMREIRALASRFGLEPDEFGRRYLRRFEGRYALVDAAGGTCVFLRGKSCTVYEDRPAQCRAFPWWPVNLKSPEAWKRAATSCEGISEVAPVVVADVIEPQLAVARAAGLAEGFAGDDD